MSPGLDFGARWSRTPSRSRSRSRSRSWQRGQGGAPEEKIDEFAGEAQNEHADFETWLSGLDNGRGALLCYLPALKQEFAAFEALQETLLPKPTAGTSVVGRIDPVLWEAVGVEIMGHRLLLARGIMKLCEEQL